ncbi:hypothetical protein GE09DRAFT_758553 [Coniochaeta sp. 2T2.1]|nr:hypothetical protein GE09DRAFT_758553 [Coniochaeta sp. 2T2.1]
MFDVAQQGFTREKSVVLKLLLLYCSCGIATATRFVTACAHRSNRGGAREARSRCDIADCLMAHPGRMPGSSLISAEKNLSYAATLLAAGTDDTCTSVYSRIHGARPIQTQSNKKSSVGGWRRLKLPSS